MNDPVHQVRPLSAVERAVVRIIRDPRDLPFVWLLAAISITVLPLAALLVFQTAPSWPVALTYLFLVIGCFNLPTLVMYHNVTHRPMFKRQYRFLTHYMNWVLGPLFGLFPNVYYAHHIAMHHVENNARRDLTSTIYYQRDSLFDFICYTGNFVLTIYGKLVFYLWRRKRFRLLRAMLFGEACYLSIVAATSWLNWKAALLVFVIPAIAAIIGLCAINWTEHAFVDVQNPANIYRSAIICVNTAYNRLAFNDGYHLSHHVRPSLHWSEMPIDFAACRESYAREGAIIFEGLGYPSILMLLLTRRYRVLARHCLDVRPEQEIVATLRQRTARCAS